MIRFKFQPTLKDFRELNRYASVRGFGRWLLILGIVLIVIFFSYPLLFRFSGDMRTNQQIYRANAPLLFLPVMYFFMRSAVLAMTFKRFKTAKELRAEREYMIDDSGIHVKGDAFSSDLSWSMFTIADCDRGYYFLRTGQNVYFYFPCAVVPDEKALIDLVSSKVRLSKNWKNSRERKSSDLIQ